MNAESLDESNEGPNFGQKVIAFGGSIGSMVG